MSGLVYLAEPIDFVQAKARLRGGTDTDRITNCLTAVGLSVYRPARAWSGVDPTSERGGALIEVNNNALDRSGLVVAYLPSATRSIGVPMEIERATGRGIPVVVFTDITTSAMVNGNPLVVTLGLNQINQTMIRWALDEARARTRHVPAPSFRQQLPVQVNEGHPGLTRHYSSDAGLDLYTTRDEVVLPGATAFVPCGVRVQLPADTWAMVTARSSTFDGRGILVPPGIIDTGYRGEIGVPVYRLPGFRVQSEDYTIAAGTRLAQLVLLPNVTRTFDPIRVEQVDPADRGENGFGSTGT